MITDDEKNEILKKAYVPEHSVDLMTRLSGGEPFLFRDYFFCHKEDRIILIGYPLRHDSSAEELDQVLTEIKEIFHPPNISFIAREAPPAATKSCQNRESDHYYTLDLNARRVTSRLDKIVIRARENAVFERSTELGEAHRNLAQEFVARIELPPNVKELLFRMWDYVGRADGSLVLSAWNHAGKLAAFYVMDMAPTEFSTYLIGCHSKENFVQGASDLLFHEMIRLSAEANKKYIHLGLGVNKGIRQFKKKWGGVPSLPYESCELVLKKSSFWDAIIGF
jgi:hypothetical protein